MKKDKLKIYVFELLLIIFLFFAIFASNMFNRITLAIILFIYTIVVCGIFKNKKINSIYSKQIFIWMIIFAFIYVSLFYLMGLYYGFRHTKILFSIETLFKYIIPIMVIIVSSEVIRKVFLMQNGKVRIGKLQVNLSTILCYIMMVLIDFIVYNDIYTLSKLDDFLIALGFVLFASLSCNLLYNYISIRYGEKSIIIYRLITILYVYIIPIVPDIYIFFQSFLRMLYPYLIYILLEKNYSKFDFIISYNDKRKQIVGNTILIVVLTLFIMLISCQFRYGILVVGSESMNGTINKGDAVIFEKYNNQNVKEGQVIIFDYNGIRTIHRVDEIKKVNNINRYYTKGDANKERDFGYITNDKIYGLVKLRVKYIGYPTLWVRKLFS